MDWAKAIEINRKALIAIVAQIVGMLWLEDDATLQRMPRPLHRAALRLLRPAESAARRLIVIAARGLVIEPPRPSRPMSRGAFAKGGPRSPRQSFQLHDLRKDFTERRRRPDPGPRVAPRIRVLGIDTLVAAPWSAFQLPPAPPLLPPDDGLIGTQPLSRRLQALQAALEDVPRQARRLVRWQAMRERQRITRPIFTTTLRPGLPPGWRAKPVHEVDHVLKECHGLALDAMRSDTS